MTTKFLVAKGMLVCVGIIGIAVMIASSQALAQTRTLSCQRADGTWYPGECKPSGGGGGGGGHRGPDVLDALIDNIIGPLFG